jgi:hypothetical protein
MSKIQIAILIYHRHKPNINLLGSYRRGNVFPVSNGKTYRVKSNFK